MIPHASLSGERGGHQTAEPEAKLTLSSPGANSQRDELDAREMDGLNRELGAGDTSERRGISVPHE